MHKAGATAVRENFRGLLINDHMCKVATTVLDADFDKPYNASISTTQCGGRGTDFASHMLRTVQQLAKAINWSHAILYIDRPLQSGRESAARDPF